MFSNCTVYMSSCLFRTEQLKLLKPELRTPELHIAAIWDLSKCLGGIDVSNIMQLAKSSQIIALNYHQNSEGWAQRNVKIRLTRSAKGKPLKTVKWRKLNWRRINWDEIRVLAAILLQCTSFAKQRPKSTIGRILSNFGLSYLVFSYLGVKLLYLLNGVLPK